MICFQNFLRLEIGNFPPKIGKKRYFLAWEYNRITAIKSLDCLMDYSLDCLSHLTKMSATPIYGKTKFVPL